VACFFSDGLTEARADGRMLGRPRLAELVSGLGDDPAAPGLIEAVRAATERGDDDMAACLVQAQETGAPGAGHVEELEVDERELSTLRARHFLEVCGLPEDEITAALADAAPIAAAYETALLRVRLEGRRISVDVSAPGATVAAGRRAPHDGASEALALSTAAAGV
jgi:hypothetical protein